MSIVRTHKSRDYTVMSNHHLNNPNLSLKAKGLLSFMLSKPDEWDFSLNGLKSQLKEGRDGIASGLQELIDGGYVIRSQGQSESGKFGKVDYDVYEKPNTGNPHTGNPDTEKPQPENPIQVSTESSKDSSEVSTEEEKSIEKDFVEEIYKAYPGKCVVQGRSTGKSRLKHPSQIRKALKHFSHEDLLKVISRYVQECKDNRTYMMNFGTFLNNIPDFDGDNELPFKEEAKSFVETGVFPKGVRWQDLLGKSYHSLTMVYKNLARKDGLENSAEAFDKWCVQQIKEKYDL